MTLTEFLIQGKRAGYAGAGEEGELAFDDGSKGFRFAAEGLTYLDRYRGFNPFAGTETIADSEDRLIWVMNYYGAAIPDHPDAKAIYACLREAMRLITPEYPFRGPEQLTQGALRYVNDQIGDLDGFHGVERIFEHDKPVYTLYYHGGTMRP